MDGETRTFELELSDDGKLLDPETGSGVTQMVTGQKTDQESGQAGKEKAMGWEIGRAARNETGADKEIAFVFLEPLQKRRDDFRFVREIGI